MCCEGAKPTHDTEMSGDAAKRTGLTTDHRGTPEYRVSAVSTAGGMGCHIQVKHEYEPSTVAFAVGQLGRFCT